MSFNPMVTSLHNYSPYIRALKKQILIHQQIKKNTVFNIWKYVFLYFNNIFTKKWLYTHTKKYSNSLVYIILLINLFFVIKMAFILEPSLSIFKINFSTIGASLSRSNNPFLLRDLSLISSVCLLCEELKIEA